MPFLTLRRLALAAAWFSLLLGVVKTGHEIQARCAGEYVYGTDDAYIHLAMARNVVEHGTYGVSPGVFSSASSSPLWTLGLALLLVLLPKAWALWAPLLLGLLSSATVLWLLVRTALPVDGRTSRWQAGVVVAMASLLPWLLGLVALSWHGLEHTLHMAVTMGIALMAKAVFEHRARPLGLWLLCAASVLVRFESVAPAAAVFLLAVVARRWRLAMAMVAAVVVPILVQGLWSLANGEHFLPNSVLVKIMIHTVGFSDAQPVAPNAIAHATGALPETVPLGSKLLSVGASLVQRWSTNVGYAANGFISFCAVLAAASFRWARHGWCLGGFAVVVVYLVTFVVQTLAVSPSESFLRYVAYLAGMALLVLVDWLGPVWLEPKEFRWRSLAVASGCALAMCVPFFAETQRSLNASATSVGVYRWHVAEAHFVATHFANDAIATEDLGAMAWWHDRALIIDLFGLANSEVCRRLIDRTWDAEGVRAMMQRHNVKVAVARPESVPLEPARQLGSRPKEWQPLGFLVETGARIRPAHVNTVFAVHPRYVGEVRAALEAEKAHPVVGTRVILADSDEGRAILSSPEFR